MDRVDPLQTIQLVIPNFKILAEVVPKKSLTEKVYTLFLCIPGGKRVMIALDCSQQTSFHTGGNRMVEAILVESNLGVGITPCTSIVFLKEILKKGQ